MACDAAGFDKASRSRLTRRDLPRFPGDTLFDKLARAVCEAECLPRKELYESWEVARRLRRRVRGGRVVDLACGHALVAHCLLLLDDTSPSALAVDARLPESAPRLNAALVAAWPRLAGRVQLGQAPLESAALLATDVVVSVHACGSLTDQVLARAAEARAAVGVLPCCHDVETSDTGGLTGWVDGSLAIDVVRAQTLRAQGYEVLTQQIPSAITPKNRLLIGLPR